MAYPSLILHTDISVSACVSVLMPESGNRGKRADSRGVASLRTGFRTSNFVTSSIPLPLSLPLPSDREKKKEGKRGEKREEERKETEKEKEKVRRHPRMIFVPPESTNVGSV